MRKQGQGFPGGLVVKNPPANAGDTGSTPGPGFLGATKPTHLETMLCNKRCHRNERRLESSLHCHNYRKRMCSNEDPGQPKRNKSEKKRKRKENKARVDSGQNTDREVGRKEQVTQTGIKVCSQRGYSGSDQKSSGQGIRHGVMVFKSRIGTRQDTGLSREVRTS